MTELKKSWVDRWLQHRHLGGSTNGERIISGILIGCCTTTVIGTYVWLTSAWDHEKDKKGRGR
jgi:hypothetical protein